MIDKKVIGIVVAALIIATPVAVFSDDIQGALNSTIAPINDTNTSDSSNATLSTSQQSDNGSGTMTKDTTAQDTKTSTEGTDSQQTTSTEQSTSQNSEMAKKHVYTNVTKHGKYVPVDDSN